MKAGSNAQTLIGAGSLNGDVSPAKLTSTQSASEPVRAAAFERKIRKPARNRKVTCQFVADKGKGSPGRLYFGDEFTILKIARRRLAATCWPRCARI